MKSVIFAAVIFVASIDCRRIPYENELHSGVTRSSNEPWQLFYNNRITANFKRAGELCEILELRLAVVKSKADIGTMGRFIQDVSKGSGEKYWVSYRTADGDVAFQYEGDQVGFTCNKTLDRKDEFEAQEAYFICEK